MSATSRVRATVRIIAIVGIAISDSPIYAMREGSYLYSWCDPQVVYNDGITTTTIRVATDNKGIASVFAGLGPQTWFPLYDDGTHGDEVPNDGIFTLNNVTTDTLGVTGKRLMYGGTHGGVGLWTKIVKTSGEVQIISGWQAELGMVDRSQVFPSIPLGGNLSATQYVFCIVDPKGNVLGAKIPLGSVKCGDKYFLAFKRLYSVFPDIFDFVIVLPAGTILDPERNYGENVPYEVNVKNTIRNIGVPIFDNSAKFYSKGRLRSMIYHSAGDGQILDHEIGHGWKMAFGESLGLSDEAHWDANTDIAGQMSNFVFTPSGRVGHLLSNGDGTWRVAREPGNETPYSKLDLYLMGLIAPNKVPAIHKLVNPDFSNPDRVTAESVETYSLKRIMKAEGGARDPSWRDAPRKFRVAFVIVKNKAFTPAEYAYYSLVAKLFTSTTQMGDPVSSFTTFYTATGGLATLEAQLPVQIP